MPPAPPPPAPPWWRAWVPALKGLAVVAGLVGVTLLSCWGAH